MTHDELLEKLDSKLQVCTCDGWDNNCWENDNQPWLALRAVVELHKPEYWENIHDPNWNGNECSVCFTDGNLETPSARIDYPCPTIQEIEKAMG